MNARDLPLIGHRMPDLPLLDAASDVASSGTPCTTGQTSAIGETLLGRHAGARFVVVIAPSDPGAAGPDHATIPTVAGLGPPSPSTTGAHPMTGLAGDPIALPVVRVATLDAARQALLAQGSRHRSNTPPEAIAVASAAQLDRLRRDAGAATRDTLWLPIDERGFIRAAFSSRDAAPSALQKALQLHRARPPRSLPPPILVVPDVLSASLCEALVARLAGAARPSGFLQPTKTPQPPELRPDPQRKRRLDHWLEDPQLLLQVEKALGTRVLPAMARAFRFQVRQHEGFKVVAYSAEARGHFARHRDDTAEEVRHRRFALSLGLSDAYRGGELRFPEYDDRGVQLRRGEAVVFSCGLLHEVRPVTAGTRHALISFFW